MPTIKTLVQEGLAPSFLPGYAYPVNQRIGDLSGCCDTRSDKSNREKKESALAHTVGVLPIAVGMSWQQSLQAPDHMVSSVGKQREMST